MNMKSFLFLLNNPKSYLSLIKFYKNNKTSSANGNSNGDANLCQNNDDNNKRNKTKKKWSGCSQKCDFHKNGCSIPNLIPLSQEISAIDSQELSGRENNINDREDKLIYVLYADDYINCFNFSEHLLQSNLAESEVFLNTLKPKLVKIEDSCQFGSYVKQLFVACEQCQPSDSLNQLMLCILISTKMANLILSDNVQLLCNPKSGNLQMNNNKDGLAHRGRDPLIFVLYDELNEINMFQIKYKLPPNCRFYNIQIEQPNLIRDIPLFAITTLNEAIYKQFSVSGSVDNVCTIQKQANRLPQIMANQLDKCSSVPANTQHKNKTKFVLFKLFPSTIKQGNGKVLVLFDQIVDYRKQIDVLFNGRSTCRWLKVKRPNYCTLQFTVPDDDFKIESMLQITIIVNCVQCLGTRLLKCEPMQIESPFCSDRIFTSLNSVDFLLQSFGVQSIKNLDAKMAKIVDQALPDFGIFKHITQSCQINLWLPTWIHLAAAYGLKELLLNLIKFPAALRACFVRNSEGMIPDEIAAMFGHQEIVTILRSYTGQIQNIRKDLIKMANQDVRCLPVDLNNSDLLWRTLLPTSPAPMQQPLSHVNHYYYHFNGASIDPSNVAHCPEPNYALTRSTAHAALPPPQLAERFPNNQLISAKNELLDLIEQFKNGISIKLFENLFRVWENKYQLVLEGNISGEFLYSLNEIRKLCQFDVEDEEELGDVSDNDSDDYED